MNKHLVNIIGWTGVVLYLAPMCLIAFKIVPLTVEFTPFVITMSLMIGSMLLSMVMLRFANTKRENLSLSESKEKS